MEASFLLFLLRLLLFASKDLFRVTDLAKRANLLRPLAESSSIGCLNAVMSMNVHRNSTTESLSLVTGAMCIETHIGVSFFVYC